MSIFIGPVVANPAMRYGTTKAEIAARKNLKRRYQMEDARYCVEGKLFPTRGSMYSAAVRAGFDGTPTQFQRRWRKGIRDWAELTKKVDPKTKKAAELHGVRMQKRALTARSEMQEVIAQLDARKAAARSLRSDEE